MMPTYQLPMVKGNTNNGQVYFKHHFGNENPYVQVPAVKYGPPESSQSPPIKIQQTENSGHLVYGVPSAPSAPPIKLQQQTIYGSQPPQQQPLQQYQQQVLYQANQVYGAPVANAQQQQQQQQNYHQFSSTVQTTFKPNSQTIDSSVITFTTGKPQSHNRPLRFTQSAFVTNPEYIPPPNILPLEGENEKIAPVPIPNLSVTPIPPLFDAQPFNYDPLKSKNTGFLKFIPLNPVADILSNIEASEKLPRFESPNVEVVNSNLVAEFSLPTTLQDSTTNSPSHNLRLNLNLANSLDNRPHNNHQDIGENDNSFAGSELNFQQNIHQDIDNENFNNEKPQVIDNLIDKITTTESTPTTIAENDHHYVVKVEPSIQTAADLSEKISTSSSSFASTIPTTTITSTTTERTTTTLQSSSKTTASATVKSKTRDRLTPIELLDSPIFHLTKTKVIQPVTEPVPAFKPMEDFTSKLATLWTTQSPSVTPTTREVTRITQTTEATIAPSPSTSTTQSSTSTTLDILSKLAGGVFAGITPPKESFFSFSKSPQSTKKPKQVQIVIPYTSFHKPSPFKAKEPQESMTFKPIRGHYVTRLTTPKNEIEVETLNGHGFHNDQEYHDHAQESKIVESKVKAGSVTTTQSPKYITKILANNIRELLLKERTPKPLKVDLMKLQRNIDGWTEQSFSGKSSTLSLKAHTKSIPNTFFLPTTITMKTLPTTTLSPKTTFDPDLMEETKRQYETILFKNKNKEDGLYVRRHDRFLNRDNELVLLNNNLTFNSIHDSTDTKSKTTISPKELWKRLHVTISPLTNEKVYIVTPQPSVTQASTTIKPRFAVRPTIGESFFQLLFF